MTDYYMTHHDVDWKWSMNDHVQGRASRQWCDRNYNPRHVPTLIGTCDVDAGFLIIHSPDRKTAKVVAGWSP